MEESQVQVPLLVDDDIHDKKSVSGFDYGYCSGAVSKSHSRVVVKFKPKGQNFSLTEDNNNDNDNRTNATQEKYVVFYPRAGLGNVMMGYVSAAMYACLTGRQLKIAPPTKRELAIFQCEEYFDTGYPQSICAGLEMDENLIERYLRSDTDIWTPEAWGAPKDHCPKNRKYLQGLLCNDYRGDDYEKEFIAISSCQYYGDLFRYNPHFKDRLSATPYKDIMGARLRPSLKVKDKMVKEKEPFHVCIHIRFDEAATRSHIGDDWAQSLNTCVRNLFAATGVRDKNGDRKKSPKKEILLFTMHQDVRLAIKTAVESTGDDAGDGKRYTVHYASETKAAGNLGLSNDGSQAVADMFSMGTKCVNLLPSRSTSTYLMMSANLMKNMRVFPGDRWKEDACMGGSAVTNLEPEGDFWNNEDVCSIRNTTCAS